MGWGSIPDDHRLMAGMVGLQTAHRYGNATLLASDFVLGIGNRWANRHTGGLDTYRRGRTFVHIDIEPTQIGRVFAPDYGITSDAGAALERLLEVARERRAAGSLADRSAWVEDCAERKRTLQRRTHFDDVPMKPQRVYEEMNRALDRNVRYVTTIGLSQIAGGQFLHVYRPRHWINCGQAGPLGLDRSGRAGRLRRRPGGHRGGAVRRLRLPVHDRGVGGRGPVQHPLPARGGEQLLPGTDPAGPARLPDGLPRPARLRQRQLPRGRRVRRRPRQGGRGAGLQGRAGARARGAAPGAGEGPRR